MHLQTILGSGGTIGTLLARELWKYTSKLRLVGRNPVKVHPSDELMEADLTKQGMVDKAVAGSDVVYLVVGLPYNLKTWQTQWPVLMQSVIEACITHSARLVFFDNVYSYDKDSIPHMTETSPMNPPSRKGEVRKQMVRMLMDNVKAGRLMALIARSADFYGPSVSKNVMLNEIVLERLKKGKKPLWFVTDEKKHSFTFTMDAARATALLGNTSDAYNQVWHLPTDSNILTIKEICEIFAREMDSVHGITLIQPWLIKVMGLFNPVLREMPEMLYQYDRDYVFDSSRFNQRFNFRPTTYHDGIRMTIRGLSNEYEYTSNRTYTLSP